MPIPHSQTPKAKPPKNSATQNNVFDLKHARPQDRIFQLWYMSNRKEMP